MSTFDAEATTSQKQNNREIKRNILLGSLLDELRRATSYWFLNKRATTANTDSEIFQLLVSICVKIIQNGFNMNLKLPHLAWRQHDYYTSGQTDASPFTNRLSSLRRLIDDFEYLRISKHMLHASCTTTAKEMLASVVQPRSSTAFLYDWVTRCLTTRCLSHCLQTLVHNQELLDSYYNAEAFLRQSCYATPFFVCITAIELNQFNLLTQLDTLLLQAPHILHKKRQMMHRRTISHPNFSMSTPKVNTSNLITSTLQRATMPQSSTKATIAVSTFRRTKSLPSLEFMNLLESNDSDLMGTGRYRRRCKTMVYAAELPSNKGLVAPMNPVPAFRNSLKQQIEQNNLLPTASPSSNDEVDMLPSTSAGSRRSQTSTESSVALSSIASTSSVNSNNSAQKQQIQLINCDDIKIWTDQSFGQTTESSGISNNSLLRAIRPVMQKKINSTSPINGFFTNLFGSTPTYTSWSLNFAGSAADDEAYDSIVDSFLPVNGKKFHKQNVRGMFQDGISMLDYTTPAETISYEQVMSTAPMDILTTPTSAAAVHTSGNITSSVCTENSVHKTDNQSLTAFLQMSRYSRNNTDLEKENAHFRISEACISAIEHVKWTRQKQTTTNNSTVRNIHRDPMHDLTTFTATTTTTLLTSNDNISYAEINDNRTMPAELLSAESVGLTLISKFNDKQLPKVSDLKWLVSEEDTPQKMLPMPTNFGEKDQQACDMTTLPSMMRGNKFWAPPRKQIIFTEHPSPNRKEILKRQNYRCTGCGMRVAKSYAQHFRYCVYLSKYFCTGCHREQISAIPAKILQNWDFRCYAVSVFAYRLIEQIYTFPLFYVPDLNPTLYIKIKTLTAARYKRAQLKYVRDFIQTCRFAIIEQNYFDDIPAHITNEPDIWSMCDFVDVYNKSMSRSIDMLIALCEEHVFNCILCTGRGFACEYCRHEKVIYPWQNRVHRCGNCGTCYHINCWKSMQELCYRCIRIRKRQNEI